MKLSKLLNLSLTIFGLEFLTSTTIEPTTNEILFKPLGNLITERSWATIRTKFNITDMFKETEQLCRAAIILDKEYLRMGNKFNGKEVRTKIGGDPFWPRAVPSAVRAILRRLEWPPSFRLRAAGLRSEVNNFEK